MRRNIGLVIAGALIGAIAMWFLAVRANAPAGTSADRPSLFASIAGRVEQSAPRATMPSVADTLAVYRSAAADASETLEAALARLAAAEATPGRDIELEAVLTRLSDLDPAHAAALALEQRLDPRFVASAFRFWAELDGEAASAALARIASPAMRQAVALSLLDVFGDSRQAADRIAGALSAAEADQFRSAWLERRAAIDPLGALREAEALSDVPQRNQAIRAVARVLVADDPAGALSQAFSLSGDAAQLFKNAVSDEWGRLDPVGFLSYVESGAADPAVVSSGFRWIVAADPTMALDIAERLPRPAGSSVLMNALYEIAVIDPEGALARAEVMPTGQERDMMVQTVASRYAMSDPEAAFEWAKALDPPQPDVMSSVVQGIVQTDFELAAEILSDPPPGVDTRLIASMIGVVGTRDSDQAAKAADGLLRQDAPLARETLSTLVSSWMRRDEEAAFDWVLDNAAELDSRMLGQAAQTIARRDPRLAASYVDRLPVELQASWIAQVAAPYAAYDANGAVAWIAQYQGTEAYEPAYRQMLMQLAQNDPVTAASMLRQASADVQLGAAQRVAMAYAQQDPRAAARWANDLADPRARAAAVEPVISAWSRNDLSAARSWTLDQREGQTRDRALSALVTSMAANGDYEPELLDEFSSDLERQQALSGLIPALGRNDADTAWALLDSEVTSAEQRRAIEVRMAELGVER